MALLSSLPSEIVTLIVENVNKQDLYACTMTNKQFHKAANPLLWRFPVLAEEDIVIQFLDGLAAATARHQRYISKWIQKLTLHNAFWTDVRLSSLMSHDLSQLEELRLCSTSQLSESSLAILPHHCPNLKTLYLWNVQQITQRFFDAVGQHCLQLTKLDFDHCRGLGGDTFAALRDCRLDALYISFPPRILQMEMPMRDLIRHFPYLTQLKVCTPPEDVNREFIQHLLSAATSAWPYLEILALGNYHASRGDDGLYPLVEFLRYHQGIKRLYFRSCSISEQVLYAIADLTLPSLAELTITETRQLSSAAIRQLVQACPKLGFILFWGCDITAEMFPEVGVTCRNFNHDHYYLHHLDQEDILNIQLGGI